MLDINPGLIIWTIITFLIVLLILRAKAWKPLLRALTEREEKIRMALQHAEDAHAESQRLLEENKRQLARAEEESQRIIKQGRELGDRLKSEIMDKANASARTTIEQAKDEIRREKDSALAQLRKEVADLAIGVAGRILDQNLDTAKQRQLADSAINDLQKN